MKKRTIGNLAAITLVLGIFLTSCFQPNDDAYLDELDITLTYYETDFNFQQYNTFAIRDSVGLIHNYLSDNEVDAFYAPGGTSDNIRSYVRGKFLAEGYTEVSSDENFDFGVNLVAMFLKSTTTIVYPPGWWWGYPGYWGWYGGGWYWNSRDTKYYGYWPPYYGWYPWGYYTYDTKTGSLLTEMADGESLREYRLFIEKHTQQELENMPPDSIPPVYFRWQALVSGVAGTTADYNKQRAERGIDEAFTQSPYLKKN